MLDTSGSMDDPTGSGPPTCGGTDSKINHARCAINKLANSYGDMVFALGRFRETGAGPFATSCAADCSTTGVNCSACGCNAADTTCGASCTAGMASDARGEMLSGLDPTTNAPAGTWTDFTCQSCGGQGTNLASQPEIWGTGSWTPIGGALKSTGRYWQGLQATDGSTIWPAASTGFNPIFNDPIKTSFLPKPSANSATCNPVPATCNAAVGCTGANCCCLSQCRPYITILLTDGAETCGGNAPVAAAAMLTTDVGACSTTGTTCQINTDCVGVGNTCVKSRYKITTKPIGFGIAAGDPDIEAIAHAGGAIDLVGNEGFYATDEAGVELAISAILKDAIKTEVCNHLDDNCNNVIDEGFNVGAPCDNGQQGVCRRTGTTDCTVDGTNTVCSAPQITPGSEGTVCNGLDDDCDGKIDEGIAGCTCIPQGETCNNMDDNCNGQIDEGITRACGTGTCQGTEHCVAGVFVGCTAPPSGVEICNGLDDDCDGIKDGITQACSTQSHGFPAGDPRNNQGNNPGSSAGCVTEGPAICVCHPGQKTCPANGPGVFGACVGEVAPGVEICNGLDDDCDGTVDEDTGGQDCSTNCGIGTTACVGGVIVCNAVTAPTDDTCDGVDDDCDGLIDEDWVSPGACGNGVVCNGMEKCVNGMPTCIGDPIGTEICNCTDDDCDGTIDENVTCPNGSSCTNCQCAFPCAGGEFPCPLGKACVNNFCVADPCFGKDCPMVGGDKEVCVVQGNAGVCVTACSQANCVGGLVCKPDTGQCVADNCSSFPDKCTAQQVCINGQCTSNPCAGVTCPTDQYCEAGQCFATCVGVDCPSGQRCELGTCQADPCGHPCPHGQVCQDATGTCQTNPCNNVLCPQGQWCDPHGDGSCSDDPCVGTACPSPDQVCIGGTCDNPPVVTTPDGAPEEHVTTGGGGGCSTGGDSTLGFGLALGFAAIVRRRRGATRGGAQ